MTGRGWHDDEFAGLGEHLGGYTVYAGDHEKIGGVDDLFLDEDDRPEYIGVRTGLPGTGSVLIPFHLVRVDDGRRAIEVAAEKELIEGSPTFTDPGEVTPEFERMVRAHYGPDRASSATRTGYDEPERHGMSPGDTGTGDELRVQRSEEELRAGTREREAGAMRVRKRVRTDRERIEVPKRREEVTVERVPASGEANEARIGDDEIVVPVTEEEVVVEKRPVAREEVRIRKSVVEDTEVIEEDVRREEIEIDDQTRRREV